MDLEIIKKQIKEKSEEFINIRRHIHENPELGMKEFSTSDFIIEKLKEFGLKEVRKIKDTGVVAIIRGKSDNCIAIRADIDALPITEDNDLDFKSKNIGVMHACGHDLHTTSLLGAAYILEKNKENLNGIVKLIFQPAEETSQGAEYMIENGVLSDEPKPKWIFGLHAWPGIEAGKVFHRHGKMGAASDKFEIKIIGKSGHAAHPNKAIDPIIVAGNVIVGIQNIVSREISALDQGVITIASIHSGDAANIIPEQVELKGSIRTLTEETRSFIHKRLEDVVKNISKAFRAEGEINIIKGTPTSYNDEKVSKIIEKALIKTLGEENYIKNPEPSMGSEDFAYYSQIIPGAMYRLGTGYANKENSPLHSSKLIINEEAIQTGVLSMVGVALGMIEEFNS